MTFYEDMQELAGNLLSEFDQGGINLVQLTAGAGTDDDPGDPTEVVHELSATARGVSFKYVQSGFALSTDLEVTAAVIPDIEISPNDFIRILGVDYKIIKDISVPSVGTIAAWKFIVRKGG